MRRSFWHSAAVLLPVALALSLLSGCSDGPSEVANDFVAAVQGEKYVEALGYVAPAVAPTADATMADLLSDDATADYVEREQSELTAKVVSRSDERDWMLMEKSDGHWRITEIGFVEEAEVSEAIPYDRSYVDDSSLWEKEERVSVAGKEGSATYAVTYERVNGARRELSRDQVSVDREPVTEVVARGTRSRSAGPITMTTSSETQISLQVTEVRRVAGGYEVDIEVKNVDPSIKWLGYNHLIDFDLMVLRGDVTPSIDGTPILPGVAQGEKDSSFSGAQVQSLTTTLLVHSESGQSFDMSKVVITYECGFGSGYETIYANTDKYSRFRPQLWRLSDLYPGPAI